MEVKKIKIQEITLDAEIQLRSSLQQDVIEEYRTAMISGVKFPPLNVCWDSATKRFWLWDGWHRLEALKKNGSIYVEAQIVDGDKNEAILLAASANSTHGLRRTNADKRRAVLAVLKIPGWKSATHAEVARQCHVTEGFVRKIRKERKHSTPPKPYSTGTTLRGTSHPIQTPSSSKAESTNPEPITGELESVKSLLEHMKQTGRQLSETARFKALSEVLLTAASGIEIFLLKHFPKNKPKS